MNACHLQEKTIISKRNTCFQSEPTYASFRIPKTELAIIRCSRVALLELSCVNATKCMISLDCGRWYCLCTNTHLVRVKPADDPHVTDLDLFLGDQLGHTRFLDAQAIPQDQIQARQQSSQVGFLAT